MHCLSQYTTAILLQSYCKVETWELAHLSFKGACSLLCECLLSATEAAVVTLASHTELKLRVLVICWTSRASAGAEERERRQKLSSLQILPLPGKLFKLSLHGFLLHRGLGIYR